MGSRYYIASCVFTEQFPETSRKIREYVLRRFGMPSVRCCVKSYKVKEFEDRMPDETSRKAWRSLPASADLQEGDEVYSLCHNCSNLIEETCPGVKAYSLWELIERDEAFPFPDLEGLKATVQDCWRSRNRAGEQAAVRHLLDRMHIEWTEAPKNHDGTDFCGISLYRPQPPRNPKLAPRYYAEGTEGLFLPHTPEEQKEIMEKYLEGYRTDTVICYCHYCLEGLLAGGKDGRHLACLLFG